MQVVFSFYNFAPVRQTEREMELIYAARALRRPKTTTNHDAGYTVHYSCDSFLPMDKERPRLAPGKAVFFSKSTVVKPLVI